MVPATPPATPLTDAVVNDFVNGEGDEVVVLDDGSLVDGLPVPFSILFAALWLPRNNLLEQAGACMVSNDSKGQPGSEHDLQVQRVAQSEDDVVQEHLVLRDVADDVHHHVRLHLIQHNSVVVEDDIARLYSATVSRGPSIGAAEDVSAHLLDRLV